MTSSQYVSTSDPQSVGSASVAEDVPDTVLFELSKLLTRSETMGLIRRQEGAFNSEERIDDAIRALEKVGVGRATTAALNAYGLRSASSIDYLKALNEELEDSPIPETEWISLVDVLGHELLANLLGVSNSSVRRYWRGDRMTPDDVAERLHVIALIVADLAGGYNDRGIRSWFNRKRTALAGASPIEALSGDWKLDDDNVLAVRNLAGALVGMGAT